ncbi:LysE family translocator, partial [Acinetobacter baumannii]|nr:LysE family translocator [Acinetobacter baumannii]EHU2566098.1 LysE family translocator [Acinetobacter baumannii]EMB7187777.1 LysE family translocator [Acinetobacter baumannii]HCA5110992.1 LysE family translocator [Acinetobacter baumannii]
MENLTAFSLFAIVASITPGPTNFIILSLSS